MNEIETLPAVQSRGAAPAMTGSAVPTFPKLPVVRAPALDRWRSRLEAPPASDRWGRIDYGAHELIPEADIPEVAADLRKMLAAPPPRWIGAATTALAMCYPQRAAEGYEFWLRGVVDELNDAQFPPQAVIAAMRELRREKTWLPTIAEIFAACKAQAHIARAPLRELERHAREHESRRLEVQRERERQERHAHRLRSDPRYRLIDTWGPRVLKLADTNYCRWLKYIETAMSFDTTAEELDLWHAEAFASPAVTFETLWSHLGERCGAATSVAA